MPLDQKREMGDGGGIKFLPGIELVLLKGTAHLDLC